MNINTKKIAATLMLGALVLVSYGALAAPVDVDVRIILPVAPQPVYVAPAPVYVQERPIYVQQRPVYVQQRPVYVEQRPVYVEHDDRYWDCKKNKCKQKKEKHHKHERDDD
ncbi:hypothetical protein ACFDR9_005198 [Janthinobacterium sp. CG_23.3]|uniref:hypothetical protein n=1 Tax=Janthinobacterium sp. CG_23.3 TaxID=3349634 RepID=UPI0038D3AB7A